MAGAAFNGCGYQGGEEYDFPFSIFHFSFVIWSSPKINPVGPTTNAFPQPRIV
jgi:hypothetical protein